MDFYFIFILISVIFSESGAEYKKLEEPYTWDSASQHCQMQSMSLAVYNQTESLMDMLIDGQTFWMGNYITYQYSMVNEGCYKKPKDTGSEGRIDTFNDCFKICQNSQYAGIFITGKERLKCFCLEEMESDLVVERDCDRKRRTLFLYKKVFSVMELDINGNVTEAHRCSIHECGNSTSEHEECDQESFNQCRTINEVTIPERNISAADDCRRELESSFTKIQYLCKSVQENITSIPLFKEIDKSLIHTEGYNYTGSHKFCLQITKRNDSIQQDYVLCNSTANVICQTVKMNKEESDSNKRTESTIPITSTTTISGSGPDTINKQNKRNPGILLAVGITVSIVFAVLIFLSVCITYACMKRRMVKKDKSELQYTQSQRKNQCDSCSEYSNVYDVVEDVATSCSIEGSSNLGKMEKLKHANERERIVGYNNTYLKSVGEMDDDEYLKPVLPSRPSVDIQDLKQTTLRDNFQQMTVVNNLKQTMEEDDYDHMQNGVLIENEKAAFNMDKQNNIDELGGEYFILCPKETVEQEKMLFLNEKNNLSVSNSKNQDKLIEEDESEKLQNGEYVQLASDPENVVPKHQE